MDSADIGGIWRSFFSSCRAFSRASFDSLAFLILSSIADDEAISLDRIILALQPARQLRLIILDACRQNPFSSRGSRTIVTRAITNGLAKIEPMQRQDFADLFEIMTGLPVTIRLLDPPLHEFLPKTDEEIDEVSKAMGVSAQKLRRRAAELHEENPMLGWRDASRYYSEGYRAGFALECQAIRKVREEIGLKNVVVMILILPNA